jgi:dimeric dUTPase (all-alpha-NTP-PPase superfamily)
MSECNLNYWTKINAMALADECHEILAQINWKPWKKDKVINREHLKEEIIDTLHFAINLLTLWFKDVDEIIDAYNLKHKENNRRQDNGY